MTRRRRVVVDHYGDPHQVHEDLSALVQGLAAGRLRPLIADVIPLDRAAHAHRLLEDGETSGKIILIP